MRKYVGEWEGKVNPNKVNTHISGQTALLLKNIFENFFWKIENRAYIFAPVLYNTAYQERQREMAR
jgi:hypothetical protein